MELDSSAKELGAAFHSVARIYCELFENRSAYSPAGFLAQLQIAIPAVYSAGARLPVIEPGDEETESPLRSAAAHVELMRQLGDFLGRYDHYWEVYDPAKPEGDEKMPVVLADDLIDIYFDLKEGFAPWARGTDSDLRNAIFEWRLGWETHWGAHAVDALRAIHWHLESHWVDAEEPPNKSLA